MFKFQRKFAFLAVPAVLALGVASYASTVAFASPSPSQTRTAAPAAAEPAEPVEPAESTTAAEAANDPVEAGVVGSGYADTNSQADTQQEGAH